MRVTENLRAFEKAVEKEIVAFFIRLGAGEAPESWRADLSWQEDHVTAEPAHPSSRDMQH